MLATTIQNEWVYVGITWVSTIVVLGGYAGWMLRRGRELSKRVPPERRRWM